MRARSAWRRVVIALVCAGAGACGPSYDFFLEAVSRPPVEVYASRDHLIAPEGVAVRLKLRVTDLGNELPDARNDPTLETSDPSVVRALPMDHEGAFLLLARGVGEAQLAVRYRARDLGDMTVTITAEP